MSEVNRQHRVVWGKKRWNGYSLVICKTCRRSLCRTMIMPEAQWEAKLVRFCEVHQTSPGDNRLYV
jgi:hypothetical protein